MIVINVFIAIIVVGADHSKYPIWFQIAQQIKSKWDGLECKYHQPLNWSGWVSEWY